jgi:hypothetical protein
VKVCVCVDGRACDVCVCVCMHVRMSECMYMCVYVCGITDLRGLLSV